MTAPTTHEYNNMTKPPRQDPTPAIRRTIKRHAPKALRFVLPAAFGFLLGSNIEPEPEPTNIKEYGKLNI